MRRKIYLNDFYETAKKLFLVVRTRQNNVKVKIYFEVIG